MHWSSTTPGPCGPSSARSSRSWGSRWSRPGTAGRGSSSCGGPRTSDLVLVDWNMPVMNGLEFIKAVRADRAYDPVRIMMVTTETEQEQVIRALEAGANEYLMKPFTQGHPGRQAQPARRACGVTRAEDPHPGRGRRGRLPPAGRRRAGRRPGAGGRRDGGQRQDRPGQAPAGQPGPGHPGRGDAGAGRAGDPPRDPQDVPEAPGHHVQRPDRAGRRGDARRPGPRGDRLLRQARRRAGWTPPSGSSGTS